VKKTPFALALVRKSARALKVARHALNSGDNDSAVSRSYYAMFDMVRAALLRSGITEEKLPRTHGGIIEAFRKYAVQSARIDHRLATQLSRTESLRIMADYTGTEIELTEATDTVQNAEVFVQTLERVFGLDESSLAEDHGSSASKGNNGVSEPLLTESRLERNDSNLDPVYLEYLRRQARENWLRWGLQKIGSAKGGG
jgi:uncharacterized protein (UPF0332 family)